MSVQFYVLGTKLGAVYLVVGQSHMAYCPITIPVRWGKGGNYRVSKSRLTVAHMKNNTVISNNSRMKFVFPMLTTINLLPLPCICYKLW